MRNLIILAFLSIILLVFCTKDVLNPIEEPPIDEVPTLESFLIETAIINHTVLTKIAVQELFVAIFKNPNLHQGIRDNIIDNRMDCPAISPDPTLPITSFPADFTFSFGADPGCMPNGITPLIGDIEVELSGALCQGVGTTACVDFTDGFNIDGQDMDGKMVLTYQGMDSSGNLCFDSTVSSVVVTTAGGNVIELKNTMGGKLTLVDSAMNDDPNNPISYIDNTICQSYTYLEVCNAGTTITGSTTTDIKSDINCLCPTAGVITGVDASGNPLVINFAPNSACTGDVIINGFPFVISGCI